jgi:DNA-binding NarL/FixJ family response regulator
MASTADPTRHDPPLNFTVLVMEPRDLVRHGVRLTAEQAGAKVAAHVSTGDQALDVATSTKPEMVILAARPTDMSGAELTRRMRAIVPGCHILVLGDESESDEILDAVVEGASGHIPTLCTPEELLARVRLVRSGVVPLSQGVAEKLRERLQAQPSERSMPRALGLPSLSDREVEVLRLLPTGMENAEIARAMSISPTTVKRHVSSILKKLDVDNRIQAAVRAVHADSEGRVSSGMPRPG